MELKQEKIRNIIAQIILADPASETPHVHTKRKHLTKGQLVRRLDKLIEEYQEAEVDIDLVPYLEVSKYLRNIKATSDYEELFQEVVSSYEGNKK